MILKFPSDFPFNIFFLKTKGSLLSEFQSHLSQLSEVLEIAQKLIIERCLIHGLPHAIDDKKPLWIRIFWSFLLFISLGIYFYFLFLISWRFWNNPDISLNFNRRPLRELPFPAVTICTPIVTPYNGSEISSFTEGTGSFSSDLVDYIANLQWCNKEATIKALNISKTQIKDIVKIVNKSQLSLDEILFKCSYRTKLIDCSKIFTRILTENGFCFTFNMQVEKFKFNVFLKIFKN